MPFRSSGRFRSLLVLMIGMLAASWITGCQLPTGLFEKTGGSLEVRSLGAERVVLTGQYTEAYYANSDAVETSVYLSDLPIEQLLEGDVQQGQLLRVDVLWIPKPGRTPAGATATNASIRYMIIAEGEVGIYGGAGFAQPMSEIGSDMLSINLRGASLQLLEKTDGFVDLMTPARITGTFMVRHDDRQARKMHYVMSQILTDAFGRQRFVRTRSSSRRAPLFH